jgi:hypothetical protein
MTLSETAAELIRTDPALAHEVARQLTAKPAGGLTRRQDDALQFIREYHAEHGIVPSYREVAYGLGLASVSGVYRLIDCLEDRGYLTRLPNQARSIVLREVAA